MGRRGNAKCRTQNAEPSGPINFAGFPEVGVQELLVSSLRKIGFWQERIALFKRNSSRQSGLVAHLSPFFPERSYHEIQSLAPDARGKVQFLFAFKSDLLRNRAPVAVFLGTPNGGDLAPIEPSPPTHRSNACENDAVIATDPDYYFSANGHDRNASEKQRAQDKRNSKQRLTEAKMLFGELSSIDST